MKTITFYSYKGGVGRSLIMANIATQLAAYGKHACLLDFDIEAPGMHYKFANFLNNQNITIERGIVDYIHEFASAGRLNPDIRSFAVNFAITPIAKSITNLIAAGDSHSSDYWRKLAAINWSEMLYENNSGISFLLDLKEKIQEQLKPELLLIDSRTGISDISSIPLTLLADDVVIVAANNRENLDGAKKIIQLISSPETNIYGRPPRITFVLSRVPFTDKPEDKMREQLLVARIERELEGLINEVNIIHSDRDLEENEQIKTASEEELTSQVYSDYIRLFEKLTVDVLSQEQKQIFQNIKKAEKEFQKALSSDTPVLKKLDHISEAIRLNDRNVEFLLYRASLYEKLGNEQGAIDSCEQAIHLDTQNIRAYELKGKMQLKLKDYFSARWAFESILGYEKGNTAAKLGLAEICIAEQAYDKAMSFYNEILAEEHVGNPVAYTKRAELKILLNEHLAAMEDAYRALNADPGYGPAFLILAKINGLLNNTHQFYLNLQLALRSGEKVTGNDVMKYFRNYLDDRRLLSILDRNNIPFDEENGSN